MPPQSVRASCWSVTINNPIAADEENMARARQRGWKVEGQKEVGKNGTPHYQLSVRTPQVRWAAVTKAFPRAHVEVARNPAALEQYVHKEDTKVGELEKQSEMYPSLSKFWDLFFQWCYDGAANSEQEQRLVVTNIKPRALENMFEGFVIEYIQKGYHIETIACNPATISCVRKYGFSILKRSEAAFYKKEDMQTETDRQTQEVLVSTYDITNDAAKDEDDEEGSTLSAYEEGSGCGDQEDHSTSGGD